MVMIEMREAAKDKAFDLLDETKEIDKEIKDLSKERKMVICELEDTLYDCFEDAEEEKEPKDKDTEEGTDLGFKGSYGHRYGMRNFDDDEDMEMRNLRAYRRRAMRMRRGMRRYA